jgi:hypothetical protein
MNRNRLGIEVVGLVLVVFLLASCGGPAATPTAQPTPTPKPLTAQDYLQATEDALDAAGTYHFSMEGLVTVEVQSQGVKLEVPMMYEGEVQEPDRMHGSLSMTVMDTPVATEVIVIGDEAWAKDPTTGQWVTSAASAVPISPGQFTDLSDSELAGMTVVGEETLDGVQVIHLTGSVDQELNLGAELGGSMQLSLVADYWIAKESNLPLKAVVGGNAPVTAQSVEMMVGMSMTLVFSDFGEPVTIEPPPTG